MAPAAEATNSLKDVALTAAVESNLSPAEIGTVSQSFFNGWRSGGDGVLLMFSKKSGPGFYRIDGTVTIDGKPAEYSSIGLYTVFSEANPNPRRVEITTTSGEKASFTLEPSKARIKILSINGQKDHPAIDITKDVVVELEGTQVPEGAMLKVGLAMTQPGRRLPQHQHHAGLEPPLQL